MTYYPVIIPTLNRYEHFKNCVESLSNNLYANETELVVGLDYPPSEKYIDGWKKIKDYIPSIKGFKTVTIFEREHNYGPSENSLSLREYAFSKYDAYIFTEDDNIFSPCFLDYMNQCLNKYREDKSIMFVCSYINKNEFSSNQNFNSVLRLKGVFNAWGYGTWKNKYKYYESTIKPNYRKTVCNNKSVILKMLKRPELFNNFYEWLKNPRLDRICDITIAVTNYLYNLWSVYPTEYLSKNNGFDGSGVNCGISNNNEIINRDIIKKSNYVIIDNFTSDLDKSNNVQYEKTSVKKMCFQQKLSIRIKIILFFLFGYDKTCSIFELLRKIA